MSKKMKSRMKTPEIKKFKLSSLVAAGYNPRVIDDDALAGLVNSISRFGCVEPIVVNIKGGANTIVGGHQRFRALQKLKVKDVICVTVSCSKKDEKLLNLSLNNPAIQGQFIKDIGDYIENLRGQIGDDDIVGLRISELQVELGCEHEKIGNVPDDDIPKPPKKAKSKRGDLYILGNHRLLCGDATESEDVERLMDGKKAGLMATDPPYGVNFVGAKYNPRAKAWNGIANDNKQGSELTEWLSACLKSWMPHMTHNACFYLWTAPMQEGYAAAAAAAAGIHIQGQIIWVKNQFALGQADYQWKHEPCWYGYRKGKKHSWLSDRKQTTVWEVTKVPNAKYIHPHQKPVELYTKPIQHHLLKGEICGDPFLGSGTSIIAAEKLGCRCFGIEIDPIYCDVIVKRWEDFTSKKARLIRGKKQ